MTNIYTTMQNLPGCWMENQIKLPLNKEVYTQTMLMARHQKIAKLFDEEFWGTQ